MAESKANWDQVGEDFKALGRQVKQHYDQRPRPERDEGVAPEDRRKVDEALEKLRDALEQAFSALGDAVRDRRSARRPRRRPGR